MFLNRYVNINTAYLLCYISTMSKTKVTEEQRKKYTDIFNLFDKNNDGTISVDELGTALRGIGNNPTQKDLSKMIKDADLDGDGSVTFEEFVTMMEDYEKTHKNSSNDELKDAFKMFDSDGSGKISATELKNAMLTMGEKLNDEEIEDMIREADKNGDGEIDYEEFVAMMTNDSS